MPEIERTRGLAVTGVINLDAIADDGDGSKGRAIALGSVGKLLLTALVVGQPSHACYPFNGLNAAALAAALATAVEWSPELADAVPGQAGMPPTLLSLKDGKTGYDVTTPASVFAIWNALTLTRGSDDLFAAFRKIAGQALGELAGKLAERRRAVTGEEMCAPAIPILTASELLAKALARQGGEQRIADAAVKAANAGFSLPEQCRIITEAAFARPASQARLSFSVSVRCLTRPCISRTGRPQSACSRPQRRRRAARKGEVLVPSASSRSSRASRT